MRCRTSKAFVSGTSLTMDEEKVEVVEAQILERLIQGFLAARLVVIPHMVCLKELAHDEQVAPSTHTLFDHFGDGLADFRLVTIASCAVDEAVPSLYGRFHRRADLAWLRRQECP